MKIRRSRGSHAEAMATCREVGRVLQSYLDGQVDELTARRVSAHLDACRRCGMEAYVYEELKQALARHAPRIDAAIVERVQAFGRDLVDSPSSDTADPASG